MTYLSEWLQGLIVLLIFAAVVEMLVPQGSTRRYVRIALGLLILLALLSPVKELLGLEPDWDAAIPHELAPEWAESAFAPEDQIAQLRDGPELAAVRSVLERRLAESIRHELAGMEAVQQVAAQVHWREPHAGGDPGFAGVTVWVTAALAAPDADAAAHGEEGGQGDIRIDPIPEIRLDDDEPAAEPPADRPDEPRAHMDEQREALSLEIAQRLQRRFGLLAEELEIIIRSPDEG